MGQKEEEQDRTGNLFRESGCGEEAQKMGYHGSLGRVRERYEDLLVRMENGPKEKEENITEEK